jgi:hypothetical protein
VNDYFVFVRVHVSLLMLMLLLLLLLHGAFADANPHYSR